MSDRVLIRDMRPSDQDVVKALVLAGMADHWDVVDPKVNPDLDDLPGTYPGSRTVVAELGGIIVATGTLVRRENATAEIVRTSVDTGTRARGVGRHVVDALVGIARDWDASTIILETNSTWEGPIGFWLACGFRITHVAPGPYGNETWFELVP